MGGGASVDDAANSVKGAGDAATTAVAGGEGAGASSSNMRNVPSFMSFSKKDVMSNKHHNQDSVVSFYSEEDGDRADIVSELKGDRAVEQLKRASIADVQAHLAMVAELAAKNPENKNMLRRKGAPKVLVRVAKEKLATQPLVAVDCFQALMVVVDDDPDMDETLGDLGVLELVVEALTSHGDKEGVVELSLRLVRKITTNSEANVERFSNLGGNQIVVNAVKDSVRTGIAIEALNIICNIGRELKNSQKMSQVGVEAAVLLTIQSHPKNPGTLVAACKAIVSLANDPASRKRMGDIGICKTLVDSQATLASNPEVVGACMRACINLCHDEMNRTLFGEAGMCASIVVAIQTYPKEFNVVNFSLMAACNISTVAAYKADFKELGMVALCDAGFEVGEKGAAKVNEVAAKLKKLLTT